MTFREQLKSLRKRNWNDRIEESISKIQECMSIYQQYDEYVSEQYNIELVARLIEEDNNFEIFFKINNQLVFEKDELLLLESEADAHPYMITWMSNVSAILRYSRLMSSKLQEMEFNIQYFYDSESKFNTKEDNVILKACLDLS